MKWVAISLAVLAAFVVALIVGPMLLGDKGYVLISLGSTAIEMTEISCCILVIGAVIACGGFRWRFGRRSMVTCAQVGCL